MKVPYAEETWSCPWVKATFHQLTGTLVPDIKFYVTKIHTPASVYLGPGRRNTGPPKLTFLSTGPTWLKCDPRSELDIWFGQLGLVSNYSKAVAIFRTVGCSIKNKLDIWIEKEEEIHSVSIPSCAEVSPAAMSGISIAWSISGKHSVQIFWNAGFSSIIESPPGCKYQSANIDTHNSLAI